MPNNTRKSQIKTLKVFHHFQKLLQYFLNQINMTYKLIIKINLIQNIIIVHSVVFYLLIKLREILFAILAAPNSYYFLFFMKLFTMHNLPGSNQGLVLIEWLEIILIDSLKSVPCINVISSLRYSSTSTFINRRMCSFYWLQSIQSTCFIRFTEKLDSSTF